MEYVIAVFAVLEIMLLGWGFGRVSVDGREIQAFLSMIGVCLLMAGCAGIEQRIKQYVEYSTAQAAGKGE